MVDQSGKSVGVQAVESEETVTDKLKEDPAISTSNNVDDNVVVVGTEEEEYDEYQDDQEEEIVIDNVNNMNINSSIYTGDVVSANEQIFSNGMPALGAINAGGTYQHQQQHPHHLQHLQHHYPAPQLGLSPITQGGGGGGNGIAHGGPQQQGTNQPPPVIMTSYDTTAFFQATPSGAAAPTGTGLHADSKLDGNTGISGAAQGASGSATNTAGGTAMQLFSFGIPPHHHPPPPPHHGHPNLHASSWVNNPTSNAAVIQPMNACYPPPGMEAQLNGGILTPTSPIPQPPPNSISTSNNTAMAGLPAHLNLNPLSAGATNAGPTVTSISNDPLEIILGVFPCVHLRNMPFEATVEDVFIFFHGLVILDAIVCAYHGHHHHFHGKPSNRGNGEAFVVFANPIDFQMALQRDRQRMGRRFIEVNQGKRADYYQAIANQVNSNRRNNNPNAHYTSNSSNYNDHEYHNKPHDISADSSTAASTPTPTVSTNSNFHSPNPNATAWNQNAQSSGNSALATNTTDQTTVSNNNQNNAAIPTVNNNNRNNCKQGPAAGEAVNNIHQPNKINNMHHRAYRDHQLNPAAFHNSHHHPHLHSQQPHHYQQNNKYYHHHRNNNINQNQNYNPSNNNTTTGGGIQVGEHTGYLRLRGLPYTATAQDIVTFFKDYNIDANLIAFTFKSDGRATGEAYVAFSNPDDSKKAMSLHRKSMGTRYIELFISYKEEHARALHRFQNR